MTYAPTVLGAPAYGMPMATPYGGFAYGGPRRVVGQPRYTIGSYAQKGYESRHVTDEKLNNLKGGARGLRPPAYSGLGRSPDLQGLRDGGQAHAGVVRES